ncbi:hypothetical protein HK102_013105, partial [Quaeritorhiza haematococci]
DFKAAGFEPVEVRSGYNGNDMGAYVEYRDERVAFLVPRLSRGKHSVAYRLRAEIPGKFHALPARGEAMYAPELKGNSDEVRLEVPTSSWDIGRTFGTRVFTVSDYLAVEDAYVETVRRFMIAARIDSLEVHGLEEQPEFRDEPPRSRIQELRPAIVPHLAEGLILSGPDIEAVIRTCLREEAWCKLRGRRSFYVHFGRDFYMYIGGILDRSLLGPPLPGMYHEDFNSPYDQE